MRKLFIFHEEYTCFSPQRDYSFSTTRLLEATNIKLSMSLTHELKLGGGDKNHSSNYPKQTLFIISYHNIYIFIINRFKIPVLYWIASFSDNI